MAKYVYKCNSRNGNHQRHYGEWNDFFSRRGSSRWGTSSLVPQLEELREGDVIIAYQTDRNELVGIAVVTGWATLLGKPHVTMKPLEEIRVKIRPLKQADPRIAKIKAFATREVKTLYPITADYAHYLLEAARRAASKTTSAPRRPRRLLLAETLPRSRTSPIALATPKQVAAMVRLGVSRRRAQAMSRGRAEQFLYYRAIGSSG